MNSRSHQAPPIDWSIDAADGPLQGPLALAFLEGRELALHLASGQSALLLGGGGLRRVLGPGHHRLAVGRRSGEVDPGWRLLFLSLGEGLPARWTAEAPLRCGPGGSLALIGGARLEVVDPTAFHNAFLAGTEAVGAAFVIALADRLLQAAVAAKLAGTEPGAVDWTPAAVQARLTALRAVDLADDLSPCGLACRELAVYTAAAPVDHGQPGREAPDGTPARSGAVIPMSGHSD